MHKELCENLDWRQENNLKPGNLKRWINLMTAIEKGYNAAEKSASETVARYQETMARYNKLVRWIEAIGEREEFALIIPDGYLESRSMKQQLLHFNNPSQLFTDAMEYHIHSLQVTQFNEAIENFHKSKNTLLNERKN